MTLITNLLGNWGCPINTPLNNKEDLVGNTKTRAAGNGYCFCDSLPVRRHGVGNERNGSERGHRGVEEGTVAVTVIIFMYAPGAYACACQSCNSIMLCSS